MPVSVCKWINYLENMWALLYLFAFAVIDPKDNISGDIHMMGKLFPKLIHVLLTWA